jgi:formylmethanofuran dehydrogenase subunit D
MSQKTVVGLTVKASEILGSRTVRIPKPLFEVLQIKTGEKVVISSGKKTRIVRAYGSELVEDGIIYLRRSDMKTLEVQEGDMIRVDRLKPISKIVKEKTKPATKRVNKGLKSIKERLKVTKKGSDNS